MAMTKKEAADFAALKLELEEARALGFSGYAPPVMLPPPNDPGVHHNGWIFQAYDGGKVIKAWSGYDKHGISGHYNKTDISASRDAIPLYATERDAMIALRLHKERSFAAQLAALDRRIAALGEK